MDSREGIKALIKALKAQQQDSEEPIVTQDYSLPDLYSSDPSDSAPQEQSPQDVPDRPFLDLSTKGLGIQTHLADALLGKSGVDITANQFPLNGKINYNGDWSFNSQLPLWGGNLNLGAGDSNGNKRYSLQYQKEF